MATSKTNRNMNAARRKKNDEFYTRLEDVQKEMEWYESHFKDKIVYLNCDDPYSSQFWFYFANQFERLGLNKLIATCYRDDYLGVLTGGEMKTAHKVEYTGSKRGERKFFMDEATFTPLKGNGDFRNQENIDILREADIVVTNPPFSLFREFVDRLVKEDKKFLIIGNMNAIKYKEIFSLIKANKIWLGVNNGVKYFFMPDDYTGKVDKEIDGKQCKQLGMAFWFTNLEHPIRNREMVLVEYYDKAKYPKYENYDAINVDKVKMIPRDYEGIMGVPITFLSKYNSEQFEIIACSDRGGDGLADDIKITHKRHDAPVVNGKAVYTRFFIRNRKPETK